MTCSADSQQLQWMQWSQHEEQPKAPPARTARRDRVPQGVIAPEQEEEEQGDQEEEASESCTDSEESSDEQDGSPQDTFRTPLSEDSHQPWAHVSSLSWCWQWYAVDKGFFFGQCRTRLKLWRSSIRFVSIDYSHIWENKWDKYLGVTIKHKKTRQQNTKQPQPNHPKNPKRHLGSKVKHYAFR